MLFDFHSFIEQLRDKPEKKQIVERYEKVCGPIQWSIQEQERYNEYVGKFNPIDYLVSDEIKDDFDRKLLLQLVVSSFSSDYELKKKDSESDGSRELYITVKSGDQVVVKTVSELQSFQVLRLYDIYIEEQMNLHALMKENNEENTIQAERDMRLNRWQAVQDTLDRSELAKQSKEEQASKLDELKGKL